MLRFRLCFVGCLLVAISLWFPTHIAKADVAPPEQPPGANPHPGVETTQVRMVAEKVLIDILENSPQDCLGQAHVSAEFQMRNLGDEPEVLMVRFPISSNDGFYNFPEIQDLQVHVDGIPVSTTRNEYIGGLYDDIIPWAEFEVNFPVGQDVLINVSYTLEGSGEYPYVSFKYLLETGAGWKDAIGDVDLIVRLPYDANPHNVFLDSSPGWGHTSPGAVLDGQDLRWHYGDLEPEYQHNLSVVMVLPSAWMKVLAERENVALNPQDGEAWGRLGKMYKEISLLRRGIRYDQGGKELFDLSAEAYQKALKLLPKDALWHAGYAELLHSRYYWEEVITGGYSLDNYMKAIEEYSLAYSLDPHNAQIQEMLLDVYYGTDALEVVDDEFVFRWLTITPTLAPTSTPTPGG
jgi:tetratricopeptide (TPR) repeat protein